MPDLPPRRAAFVTIGQSPREDILSEMKPWWTASGSTLAIEEVGVLDGIEPRELRSFEPSGIEERLVSRLRDGTEVVLRAKWVEERVQEIVSGLEAEPFDFVVLLCTGRFPGLASRRLLVQAQSVVDHGLAALARGMRAGVLLPHEEQTRAFRCELAEELPILVSHASPYSGSSANSGNRLEQAALELREADVIVLHCMGYDESTRREMAKRTGRPVLLARRMVAAAVAQLL
jgi:protein AroM